MPPCPDHGPIVSLNGMKHFLLILAVVLASIAILAAVTSSAVAAPDKPNVILILRDDMGIDSVSAFNAKMGLKTPAIDQLAKEGMSFKDAHSNLGRLLAHALRCPYRSVQLAQSAQAGHRRSVGASVDFRCPPHFQRKRKMARLS